MSIAERVSEAWSAHTEAAMSRPPSGPRSYVYASGWRACTRAMALDLMHPEDRTYSEDAFERFYDGNDYEDNARARLLKSGKLADPTFRLLGAQERFEIKDRAGRVVIVGKLDEQLQFDGSRDAYPVEIKSGVSVQRIEGFDDFQYSPWTRPMPYQLLSYLLGKGAELGLFILNRPGRPKFIEVPLEPHLDMAESFLRDATTAVDCLEGADLPPHCQDRAECRRCDHYGKSCAPDVDFGPGVRIIDDEDLHEAARVRHANKDAAKEFNRADKKLKAALRGVEHALIGGEFEACGKWQQSTKYDVPQATKDMFKTINKQGRFILDIERIED